MHVYFNRIHNMNTIRNKHVYEFHIPVCFYHLSILLLIYKTTLQYCKFTERITKTFIFILLPYIYAV